MPSTKWTNWFQLTGVHMWRDLLALINEELQFLNAAIDRSPLYNLLVKAAALSFLVAAVHYVMDRPRRIAESRIAAWDVIEARRGSTGDRGRVHALALLSKTGDDLEGLDLRKLAGRNLALSQPLLSHANLDSSSVHNLSVRGGDLRWTCGAGIDLDYVRISQASMSRSSWPGARMHGAKLIAVRATNVNLDDLEAPGAVIRRSHFDHSSLRRTALAGASVLNTSFVQTVLDSSSWQNSKIHGTKLNWTSAIGASFSNSSLTFSSFRFASLQGSDFSGTTMHGTDFTGADLTDSTLPENLRTLRIGSLRGANLMNVKGISSEVLSWAIDTMGAVILPTSFSFQAYRSSAFGEHSQRTGLGEDNGRPCRVDSEQ